MSPRRLGCWRGVQGERESRRGPDRSEGFSPEAGSSGQGKGEHAGLCLAGLRGCIFHPQL